MFHDAYASLFTVNMGVKKGERILIFSDTVRPDETPTAGDADRRTRLLQTAAAAALFADKNYGNTTFISFPATAASGAEPPEQLWRAALGNAAVDKLAEPGLLARLIAKEATPEQVEQARGLS